MHTRAMARVLNKRPEDSRIWKKGGEKPMSDYEYYDHDKLNVRSAKGPLFGVQSSGPANGRAFFVNEGI